MWLQVSRFSRRAFKPTELGWAPLQAFISLPDFNLEK